MTFEEFEETLKKNNLLKIFDRGSWKYYTGLIDCSPSGMENSFGIMKCLDSNCYTVFITDEQRGGQSYYWDSFEDINEACNNLFYYITLCDNAYKEIHPEYTGE